MNQQQRIIKFAEDVKKHQIQDILNSLYMQLISDLDLSVDFKIHELPEARIIFDSGFIYGQFFLDGDQYYNFLTSSIDSGCSVDKIELRKTLNMKISGGIRLDADLIVTCNMPQEDIDLLESMGKIETHIEQSKQTSRRSISCAVESMPF